MEIKAMDRFLVIAPKVNPHVKKKTESGLYIPETTFNKQSQQLEEVEDYMFFGEVIIVGPDVKHVKVGDHVLTNKMNCQPFSCAMGEDDDKPAYYSVALVHETAVFIHY